MQKKEGAKKASAPKTKTAAGTGAPALKRAPAVGADELARMTAEHLIKLMAATQASPAPAEAKPSA